MPRLKSFKPAIAKLTPFFSVCPFLFAVGCCPMPHFILPTPRFRPNR